MTATSLDIGTTNRAFEASLPQAICIWEFWLERTMRNCAAAVAGGPALDPLGQAIALARREPGRPAEVAGGLGRAAF